MARPMLDQPCAGWQADLPLPETPPNAVPSLGFDAPNHRNEVWLEIPRRSSRVRGIIVWLAPIMVVSALMMIGALTTPSEPPDYAFDVVGSLILLLCIWMVCWILKTDIAPPRDEPLRFNRARQKIYAYNFKYRWWNPFGRWRVAPVAYDWSQVRAESWRQRGVTAQGGVIFKWGVVLSIVAPGTNKVIDRFHLSTMGADERAWAYVCTYMQQGPDALPPSGEPHDPDVVPWYNLALRLAPRVKWPEAMDIESRTAP